MSPCRCCHELSKPKKKFVQINIIVEKSVDEYIYMPEIDFLRVSLSVTLIFLFISFNIIQFFQFIDILSYYINKLENVMIITFIILFVAISIAIGIFGMKSCYL